jgi:hypothetical protein
VLAAEAAAGKAVLAAEAAAGKAVLAAEAAAGKAVLAAEAAASKAVLAAEAAAGKAVLAAEAAAGKAVLAVEPRRAGDRKRVRNRFEKESKSGATLGSAWIITCGPTGPDLARNVAIPPMAVGGYTDCLITLASRVVLRVVLHPATRDAWRCRRRSTWS